MSDRRRGDGEERGSAVPPMAADFAAPDFAGLTTNLVNTWSQVNGRLLYLAQASLRNNLAAAEELRHVQSPADLVDTQMRLARKAYDDCLEEAVELGQLVQKMSTEALEMFSARKSI